MNKIAVVSGGRADYYLLMPLILKLQALGPFDVHTVITGAHLSPEFRSNDDGLFDGIASLSKVEILVSSDSPTGISSSFGVGVLKFGEHFSRIRPTLLILLGDRYEILAAAVSAYIHRIPIAHIHGGEITEAAYDDAFRHSITKLSSIHFVANERYAERVIQMGEQPETVHVVGGLGVDNCKNTDFMSLEQIGKSLNIPLKKKIILVTFHPETLDTKSSGYQVKALLEALDKIQESTQIITYPNADDGSRIIKSLFEDYCRSRDHAHFYASLGSRMYLSLMRSASVVIGNSSSGLTEAPTFRVPTINIGDRQRGRERALSVIDCFANSKDICDALNIAFSDDFLDKIRSTVNPYGDGGAINRICEILSNNYTKISGRKTFYDIPYGMARGLQAK